MAKRIKNPIEYKVVKMGDEFEVSAHYGVECDDGLETRRGMPITLSQSTIEDIDEEGMAQINANEGIV